VLTGLGLLEMRDGAFVNSAAASAFLVSSSPAYMGNAMRYSDQLYATWGRLDEALRSGKPALAAESYLGDDEARTRTFVHAMHGRAMASLVCSWRCSISGPKAMLDVGSGSTPILLTERNPGFTRRCSSAGRCGGCARDRRRQAVSAMSLRDGDYHLGRQWRRGADVGHVPPRAARAAG
jgi:hypothetical protein